MYAEPGDQAWGKPRSYFNFNGYAHGSRSGTKVPLPLLEIGVKVASRPRLVG